MITVPSFDTETEKFWQKFVDDEKLTAQQAALFLRYMQLLQEWNEKMNLTRIVDASSIIAHHFQDSLAIRRFMDLSKRKGICDIGSGGGFPGIPLKIMYPDVPVILIEVIAKKATFLRTVITELKLENIEVSTLDWRSFTHTAPYTIDLFVSRASLRPDELVRIFVPKCAYKNALMVYWASATWEMGAVEAPFFVKEESYIIDDRKRRLLFFSRT